MRISDWSSTCALPIYSLHARDTIWPACATSLRFLLLRRAPAPGAHRIGDPDTAPRQRLAQQAFDLGVDAPEIGRRRALDRRMERGIEAQRSEEHTSELQSLIRISYAVFCLQKKKTD